MKSKKLLSTILALVMLASMATTTFAITAAPGVYESGGNESVPVTLNVAPAIFSVTVPSVLPVSVTADGEVVCAESGEARIINYSHGAVKVTNLEIDAINGWETVDYDSAEMHKVAVNSRLFAFTINEEKTTGADAITFDTANFPVLDGANDTDSDELVIDYDALIAPQNAAVVDMDIANIVFTIAWEEKEVEMIEFAIKQREWQDGQAVYPTATYQAEKDMTWVQWLNSKYNTIGLVEDGYGGIINSEDTKYIELEVGENTYNMVRVDDTLIENATYFLNYYPN